MGHDTVIIAIYRPHCFKDTDIFISSLSKLLEQLSAFKNIVIIGDININLLDQGSLNTSNYLEALVYHGVLPAYELPTRGENCIDHVMLKSTCNSISLVLDSTVTDHNAVFFLFGA